MSDEMKNKSEKIGGGKTPGIGGTVDQMNEFDMNKLNDTIEIYHKKGK